MRGKNNAMSVTIKEYVRDLIYNGGTSRRQSLAESPSP